MKCLIIFTFIFFQLPAIAQHVQKRPGLKEMSNNQFGGKSIVGTQKKSGIMSWFSKDVEKETKNRIEHNQSQSQMINSADSEECKEENMTCFYVSNEPNQLRNFESDEKVCNCLQERFKMPIPDIMQSTQKELEERDKKIEEGKLLAALWELKKNYIGKRDALLLEAHFVGDKERLEVLSEATISSETTDSLKAVIHSSFKGKVDDKHLSDALVMIDNFAMEDEKPQTVLENLTLSSKRPESCYPFAEYLKVSMIPDTQSFWKDLYENKELKDPDSWNYHQLVADYNEGINREEIKSKLNFLNRNPSLKTIFKMGTHEEKAEAYKRLRDTLKPSSKCVRANNCRASFLVNGGNLQESLKDLYTNPKVTSDLMVDSFVEIAKEISGVGLASFHGPTLPALRFAYASSGMRYDRCNTSINPSSVPGCAELFENYCGEIRAGRNDLYKNLKASEETGNYYNSWISDLEADPVKNKGYVEFQDKMCNRIARSYPGSRERMNFKKFKEDHCAKVDCAQLEDTQLFKTFLASTEASNQIFNDKDELVEDTEGIQLIAKASYESITAVENISDDIVGRIKETNKLSFLGNSDKKSSSITELLAQVSSSDIAKGSSLDISTIADISSRVEISSEDVGATINENFVEKDFKQQFLNNEQGYLPQYSLSDNAISEARNELNELKKEELAIKNEVGQVKSEIKGSQSPETKSALESRLDNLEMLLAEKEKSSQNYQNLIAKLMESKKKEAVLEDQLKGEEGQNLKNNETLKKVAINSPVISNKPVISEEQHSVLRSPASIESFSTSSSAKGGAATSTSASYSSSAFRNAPTRYNGALLSKYGIVVQETPGSSVSVAPETEGTRFLAMGPFKDAANIPVKVSQTAFDRFKVNDLSALQELYKDSIEKIDDEVVKILVSSQGSSETLEFYAIKEDGKVVFQPIRKVKLSDLKNTLQN